jgi:hypothetical protein
MHAHHDVLPRRQLGEEVDVLKCPDNATLGDEVSGKTRYVFAFKKNTSVCDGDNPSDHIKQRGLASPVGSNEPRYLPSFHTKSNFV